MLSDSFTVIEEMREAYSLYSDTELRGLLGRFLFRNEDVFKPVSALSGGERARLALLKLMLSGANLLVLDEPTNHLDIASKEVFEDALMDFPGTCVIVSHDRYLLNKVPTAIYELTSEGITVYQGNYDYYNEKKAEILSGSAYMNDLHRNNSTQADLADDGSADLRQQRIDERRKNKELQAEQRRLQRRQEALEKEIETLEQDISDQVRGKRRIITACDSGKVGHKTRCSHNNDRVKIECTSLLVARMHVLVLYNTEHQTHDKIKEDQYRIQYVERSVPEHQMRKIPFINKFHAAVKQSVMFTGQHKQADTHMKNTQRIFYKSRYMYTVKIE